MNIDDLLRYLAPLTPAVLPVLVFIWIRTRRELRAIREEIAALRDAPALADPRLEDLIRAVEGMESELSRLAESQRAAMRALPERDPAPARLESGVSARPPEIR